MSVVSCSRRAAAQQQAIEEERPPDGVAHHAFAVDPNLQLPKAVGAHGVVAATSAGRTMPRTVIVWRSELISTSLVASTSMAPLGSTAETRAVSVVEITTSRLVVPWPSSCVSPLTPARFAHGPAALVMPAERATEFLVLEVRAVLVVPLATAEALSTTRMVIMSSIWLALEIARRIGQPRSRRPDRTGRGSRSSRGAGACVGNVVIQRRLRGRRGLLLGGQRHAADQQDRNQELHRLPFVTTTLPLDSTRA